MRLYDVFEEGKEAPLLFSDTHHRYWNQKTLPEDFLLLKLLGARNLLSKKEIIQKKNA